MLYVCLVSLRATQIFFAIARFITRLPNFIPISICIANFVSLLFISPFLIFLDDHLFYPLVSILYLFFIELFYPHPWNSLIHAAKSTWWWNIFFISSFRLTHLTFSGYLQILLGFYSAFWASKGIVYLPLYITFDLAASLLIFYGTLHTQIFISTFFLFHCMLTVDLFSIYLIFKTKPYFFIVWFVLA